MFCISWRATRCSRSLDSTDKFDIGWYELTLVASKPAFFTTAVMNASLNTAVDRRDAGRTRQPWRRPPC